MRKSNKQTIIYRRINSPKIGDKKTFRYFRRERNGKAKVRVSEMSVFQTNVAKVP
jgi:hypothetical protein